MLKLEFFFCFIMNNKRFYDLFVYVDLKEIVGLYIYIEDFLIGFWINNENLVV